MQVLSLLDRPPVCMGRTQPERSGSAVRGSDRTRYLSNLFQVCAHGAQLVTFASLVRRIAVWESLQRFYCTD